MNFAGIDYGSKLAGTTVIAALNAQQTIQFFASEKKKDADQFILQWAIKVQPQQVFLDAPLSLPGVYANTNNYADYFYRQADRAVRGMSPMFLGGLTARAMQLRAKLASQSIEVTEVYPSQLVDILNLDRNLYKKQPAHIPTILAEIASLLPYSIDFKSITTWHHVDALLAFLSGYRFANGQHQRFGNPEEGEIIV